MKHIYGLKPDKKDHRDLIYSHALRLDEKVALPPMVDLRPYCSPIEDQKNLGSCTAHALAGAYEFLELKELKQPGIVASEITPGFFSPISRLFVYYNERLIEGTINEDSGAMLRDGIKALATYGVCKESLCPYIENQFKVKPTDNAYNEAINHKISSYMRLTSLYDFKHCLADGYPFVFGISVYESFESDQVAKTGVIPMPQENEECLGGHAVCAVGYSDDKKAFIVRNSWSTNWGFSGHFFLPYAYITNPNLAEDFWTLRK